MPAPDPLKFPPVIDLATIGALRAKIMEHQTTDLALDVGAVEKMGGLGVQLLLTAARTWSDNARDLSIVNASTTFLETLRLTGATSLQELCR